MRITGPTLLLAPLALAVSSAIAQPEDPFAALAQETRPLATRWQTDYTGSLELGLGYVSDDNFMFGQYNGLHEDGVKLIGNFNWNSFSNADSYWQASLTDLGLDTREGKIVWGLREKLRITAEFDSQLQVRNNSGSTPFRGQDNLTLPADWVSGLYTADFDALQASSQQFDRELERDHYSLAISAALTDNWQLDGSVSYEDKQGTGDIGGAIYIDASSGDAALLPAPVDYRTTELDLGLAYSSGKLNLDGRLAWSDFDNKDDLLSWQNPYSSYGSAVRYPAGTGGLGVAPDNTHGSARLSGTYLFSSTARLQFDGSYSLTEQDQDFLDYTVNQQLNISEPLPRNNLGGEVATTTFKGDLVLRPLPRLTAKASYRLRDRDYDKPRDGYRYVPGDGGDQSRSALTVYNTSNDLQSQTAGLELSYRLPKHNRLRLEIEGEQIERENAAVEETEETRITGGFRFRPWQTLQGNLEVAYYNRAADTYQWDQSYYALRDAELINATPDNQRYLNHPELSQYYLSNRERSEVKLDFSYLPVNRWSINLNLLWREDDYDKSELGLTDSDWQRVHASASYAAGDDLTFSVYGGLDRYESSQSSRAFRGGQEKNAFAIYPPLPQASDPSRNWDLDAEDDSLSLGASATWQMRDNLELEANYSFIDTSAAQDFKTFGAADLDPQDLPDVETRQHQLGLMGTWHMREALSLKLEYLYFRYDSDDWAWQDVQSNTVGKVLTFGERNPNETIHYMGASVLYRWQ